MDTVGAVYLLRQDGAALLQHRDNKIGLRHADMWVPPGGHCECGEDVEACARREMFEETDYMCERLHFLHSIVDEVSGWDPYRLCVFWERYDGQQILQCREGQSLKFVLRTQASMYKIPQYLVNLWDMALKQEFSQNPQ